MADAAELRAACSEKEARCAEAYLRCGSHVEAAKEAGYQGKRASLSRTGRRVLERPRVQAYLDALRAEALGETKTVLEQVRDRLMRIGMGEKIHQPVGRGGTLKLRPAAASTQVKALETLARMHGGLDPRVSIEVGVVVDGVLEALSRRVSPEAYAEALAALRAAYGDLDGAGG